VLRLHFPFSDLHWLQMPYVTYKELFDRVPTKDELNGIMKGLNAFNTVLLASRLNTMLWHSMLSRNPQDINSLSDFQHWFAGMLFDEDTHQRVSARLGAQSPELRRVCVPLQLLNIIRLALSIAEGDDNACPDSSRPHTYQLGTASLMVNDLFVTQQEQENLKKGSIDDRRKQLMLQFLAPTEVSKPTPLRNLLFRSYATYQIVLRDPLLVSRVKKECGGLDIERDFETLLGIPLMGWMSLVYGVQTLLLTRTQEEFMNKPETFLLNRKTLLPDSNLSQGQIDGFFDMLSMSFDELRLEVRKADRKVDDRYDLVPFKSKPLFMTAPDTYACIDFGLFGEKLHTGPYFLLSDKLPPNERGKVFKAWGFLFEAYVNWLLQSLHGRHSGLFYPDTCWEDGKKSFDAVLVKDKMAVTMEFKGGFLPQEARYSNDLAKFMDTLEARIGVGCRQLARDIGALFPEKEAGKKLRNVTIPPNTLWVLPVLVVQDLMLRTRFVNYFLNQRFQSERTLYPVRRDIEVLPLAVVQITDLEDLVEMAEAFDLDVMHFFHWRTQMDSGMLGNLQEDFINQIPEHRQSGESKRFQEIFNKSLNEMYAIFFKDGKRNSDEGNTVT
jgi:hypothetical protein